MKNCILFCYKLQQSKSNNIFISKLQIYKKYDEQYPMSEWRFELRVRYSPDDLEDLYENDRFTFFFYYDQVRMILKYLCYIL